MRAALNHWISVFPKPLAWALGALPFLWIVLQAFTGGLGVDPVKTIEHDLGKQALWMLMLGLGFSPVLWLTGINLMRFRGMLGLLAFYYACAHVLAWFVLDMGLMWTQALMDMVTKPYLIFGLIAFLILAVLAFTSWSKIRQLLGKWWQPLHRLTYVAVGLAVIHYLWQMKVISQEGWVWLAIFAVILVLRVAKR